MIEKIIKVISNLKILSKMNEIIDGLNTHTANKNNPHNVTAEQLGLATAYVYKGSVPNFSDLPNNAQNGWVYSVENEHTDGAGILHPAGANFAWNGSKWDDLGGSLSSYAKSVNSQSPDNKGNVNLTLVESLEKNTEDKLVVHNSDGSIQELEVGKKYTINNKLPDANDNYDINEFEGYWKSNESVSVGDVRFLKGRNNTNYLLECVQSGVTGTEQPTISEDTILADYSDNTVKWGVRKLTNGLAELENIVPISKGGTGANTASQACVNLGAVRSVNNVTPDSNGNVKVESTSLSAIVDLIYPVGSLYWSKKSTSPATLFGGTWTQIKDKFILACGDTYGLGAEGGSATVTLTTAQLPAHNHSASTNSTGGHTHSRGTMEIKGTFEESFLTDGYDDSYGIKTTGALYSYKSSFTHNSDSGSSGAPFGLGLQASKNWTGATSSAGGHSHTVTVNDTGSGNAHENMPPYVTYYCWERTA